MSGQVQITTQEHALLTFVLNNQTLINTAVRTWTEKFQDAVEEIDRTQPEPNALVADWSAVKKIYAAQVDSGKMFHAVFEHLLAQAEDARE